jgi:hypothetical protein
MRLLRIYCFYFCTDIPGYNVNDIEVPSRLRRSRTHPSAAASVCDDAAVESKARAVKTEEDYDAATEENGWFLHTIILLS